MESKFVNYKVKILIFSVKKLVALVLTSIGNEYESHNVSSWKQTDLSQHNSTLRIRSPKTV